MGIFLLFGNFIHTHNMSSSSLPPIIWPPMSPLSLPPLFPPQFRVFFSWLFLRVPACHLVLPAWTRSSHHGSWVISQGPHPIRELTLRFRDFLNCFVNCSFVSPLPPSSPFAVSLTQGSGLPQGCFPVSCLCLKGALSWGLLSSCASEAFSVVQMFILWPTLFNSSILLLPFYDFCLIDTSYRDILIIV